MADKSHIHRFTVTLSDVNRNVYAEFPVTAARHPSETEEYFAVRILVYILHWQEGIRFGRGVCAGEEPAVYVEETGRYKLWVEFPTLSYIISSPARWRCLHSYLLPNDGL